MNITTPDMGALQILPFQRHGAGTPLVLVHGYLGGSSQWDGQLPVLRLLNGIQN